MSMLGSDTTHIVGSMNWEPVRKRLLAAELEDALQAVTELRESMEVLRGAEYPLMLSALLPALSSIITSRTKPSPDTTSVDHRLRHAVLEFMARFPQNDKLRPHAPHLVAVALDVLTRDFEANALLSCRIIFDLFKVYRNLPQDHVQPFLEFVLQALRNMPTAVIRNFSYSTLTSTLPASSSTSLDRQTERVDQTSQIGSPSMETEGKDKAHEEPSAAKETPRKEEDGTANKESTPPPATSSDGSSPAPNRLALRSNASFRVLTECPLILMLLFQFFPKFQKTSIPSLIAAMTEILGLRPPSFQSFPPPAKNDVHLKRIYYTRVRELIAAQAKTLSFLTYLLRGFASDLKPYAERLASNVVALMSSCPKESIGTRKELLVATRHLLSSDFRHGFFRHVDVLLDEKVLLGSHHRYADNNLLRPLGYTTLSELVQHVRTKLTMAQVSRVVSIFSRVLHDSTVRVALGTQYSACRTLLSLIELAYHNKDSNIQLGRDILIRILSTLVDKLKALVVVFPDIYKAEKSREESRGSVWQKRPDPLAPSDTVRDVQSMVRTIIAGCKTLIYYAANYRNQRDKTKVPRPQPGVNDEVVTAMLRLTNGEILIVQEYILSAIPAIKLLKEEGPCSYSLPGDKTHSEHYRDALTYFAASFTGLDGFTLRRTLGRQLEFTIDAIIRDPVAMVFTRHLLASNATTSFEVCGMMLNYLVDHMDDLALCRTDGIVFLSQPGDDEDEETGSTKCRYSRKTCAPLPSDEMLRAKSTTLLHLFERVLKSLSIYSENEKLVRRHLRRIVVECLRSSMENSEECAVSYNMLLRYIFRSISAGKFEESYKELLPLIPTVLNGLYKIICSSVELPVRHTAIELCLTIPARLSSLLPHMNLLLRVIVRALISGVGDLVNLG
jgi:transformation/transcription domain-associated protein